MKHVKLFEQFLNESKDEELKMQYAEELKAQGYDVDATTSTIKISGIEPKFDKKFKDLTWSFYYSPGDDEFVVYGRIDKTKHDIPDYIEWNKYAIGKWKGSKIKSSKDIIDGLKSFKKWDVKFNMREYRYYWAVVLDRKSRYRHTERGDLNKQDIKDMNDFFPGWFGDIKITKHPVLGFNIISFNEKYHWDGKDVWYGKIEGGKDWKFGSITSVEELWQMEDNSSPSQSTRAWESKRHSLDRTIDYVEKSEELYHTRR